jgi:hypothetical protein
VPISASVKVAQINDTFHTFSIPRFSCTMIECRNAVPTSHGITEAFSTGSQAQYPPQPSSVYDQSAPSMIPMPRKVHAISAKRRVARIQSAPVRRAISAPIANANGIEKPT